MLIVLGNIGSIARMLMLGYAVVVWEDTRVEWKKHETKRFKVCF